MKKTELYIKSTNDVNNLHTIVWEPESEIKADCANFPRNDRVC